MKVFIFAGGFFFIAFCGVAWDKVNTLFNGKLFDVFCYVSTFILYGGLGIIGFMIWGQLLSVLAKEAKAFGLDIRPEGYTLLADMESDETKANRIQLSSLMGDVAKHRDQFPTDITKLENFKTAVYSLAPTLVIAIEDGQIAFTDYKLRYLLLGLLCVCMVYTGDGELHDIPASTSLNQID